MTTESAAPGMRPRLQFPAFFQLPPAGLIQLLRLAGAPSSSLVVAETVWSGSGSNVSSELASTTAIVTAVTWSPTMSRSSTPATVTVCGVLQFAFVNVSVPGATVTSPVSPLVTVKTTFVSG